MGIRLNIEIISPLGPDDKELLTGVAIMTLAIANHELAKLKFPDAFDQDEPQDEPTAEPVPQPCGAVGRGGDEGKICVNYVGHRGRHRFRMLHVGGIN